jgi:large subunit GTPase 1
LLLIDLTALWQNKEASSPLPAETPPEPEVESQFVWGDGNHEKPATTNSFPTKPKSSLDEIIRRQCRVLTRQELIYFLSELPKSLGIVAQSRHRGHLCVGLVGFPNVGKSSVINTILGVSKSSHGVLRVGVSSTPGKTKHFQTLDINDELMLCDCPGLVFPSFMKSRGDMVCAGILPINQMRDYADPANIIATRVPQHLLEAAYGIHIRRELDIKDNPNRPPTGSEFLVAFCAVKGYITAGTGRWDEFRACKEVLRDYNDGRILYVAPPPPMVEPNNPTGVTMEAWLRETELTMSRRAVVANRLAQRKLPELDSNEPQSESTTTSMVFTDGDVLYEFDPNDTFVDNESESVTEESTEEEKNRREHKRLKHWGKKNRKLREKNPYDDGKGVYIVHTTNRTGILRANESTNNKPVRTRRQDPHYGPSHETSFVRAQPIPTTSSTIAVPPTSAQGGC